MSVIGYLNPRKQNLGVFVLIDIKGPFEENTSWEVTHVTHVSKPQIPRGGN